MEDFFSGGDENGRRYATQFNEQYANHFMYVEGQGIIKLSEAEM
jgi:hypothetical protein